MSLLKTQGIVLKHINLGESDKIITLFTDKLGKIQVVAHGARKPKSKLLPSTQVFSYSEYILYKGKSLYTISQSEIKESFQGILNDLYTLTYSSYIMELTDALAQNEESNIYLFVLLLKTLYLIKENSIDLELLIRTFEIKSMSIAGFMPNLSTCCICGKSNSYFNGFNSEHGGVVCPECIARDAHSIKVDTSTLNAMKYLIKTDIEKIRMLKVTSIIKNEMKKIMRSYIKYHTERDFKSLNFLENLNFTENS